MKKLVTILLSISLWAHTAPHHTPPLPPLNTHVAITYLHSMDEGERLYHTIKGQFLGLSPKKINHATILCCLGEKVSHIFIPIKDIEVITPRFEIDKIIQAWLN